MEKNCSRPQQNRNCRSVVFVVGCRVVFLPVTDIPGAGGGRGGESFSGMGLSEEKRREEKRGEF